MLIARPRRLATATSALVAGVHALAVLTLAVLTTGCAGTQDAAAQEAAVRELTVGDLATKGARVYENYCATCHGEELQNNSNGVTFDLRRLKADERGRFVNSVLNGKNKMPPWKGVLEPSQIDQIWAYIRATIGD